MSDPSVQPVSRLVLYSGRVQGVGFRATAVPGPRRVAVTGWVRNLPDGRVRLLAEGPAGEVERFLGAIREQFDTCIDDTQEETSSPTGKYRSFEIVR
jgi:acylphosphatase